MITEFSALSQRHPLVAEGFDRLHALHDAGRDWRGPACRTLAGFGKNRMRHPYGRRQNYAGDVSTPDMVRISLLSWQGGPMTHGDNRMKA